MKCLSVMNLIVMLIGAQNIRLPNGTLCYQQAHTLKFLNTKTACELLIPRFGKIRKIRTNLHLATLPPKMSLHITGATWYVKA